MRAKDAIDVECKTAQKSVERQMKLLERAQETERNLTAQIVSRTSGQQGVVSLTH
jgi:E3 ubiquitin-protein ligase BRE1